ncbi:MAG TPA: type II toxin-antitoxin system VapC family toxin [Chthonomonadaceae bacterium]|jgi:predicted nucleic acid-binding protein|nr:type II toxin-antitoxin system VapC family toxin [Chthonomonadaceae bacterium]
MTIASASVASVPSAVVVDASVAVKWLLPEPYSAEALKLLSSATTLHAPDLLLPKVGNILWKRVRGGEITVQKARQLLEWLATLPIQLYPSLPLMLAAIEIACQYDRTVYDSLYLALAVQEKTLLVTADAKLLNALSGTPLAASLLLVQAL